MKRFIDKKLLPFFGAIFLFSLFPAQGNAGVMIGGTRFIYKETSQKGLSVLVRNSDEMPYLVQTRVLPDASKGNEGTSLASVLVATPPLMPLGSKQENVIRIVKGEGALPTDRESLFQLIIAAIPSGRPDSRDVQLAIRSSFKLLYRPSGLKGNADVAYQQLLWRRQGTSVTVENPTPYYVTLFKMFNNGKIQPAQGVVSPFASRTENWCPTKGVCRLQWQSLNDLGLPTKPWVINPVSTPHTGDLKKTGM